MRPLPIRPARLALLVATGVLSSACASRPPADVHYQCPDGRHFAVRYAADGQSAVIDIARMQFPLQRESVPGPARRYACSVLALVRDGERASVDIQGDASFRDWVAAR